jgi:hypothetical protein
MADNRWSRRKMRNATQHASKYKESIGKRSLHCIEEYRGAWCGVIEGVMLVAWGL